MMVRELTIEMTDADRRQAQALSEQPRRPPLRVPGYEREQFLGKGAFGEVWVAVNSNNGRRVAIKFYNRRGGLDWSLLSREVEKLSHLFSDRYVVQLLDVGWEADPPYYVMEFMQNGSLEERLQSGTIPVDEAVELFHDIAFGLLHAHEKGILHCDLKPANVLLDQDLKPRLADFGQSRLAHEQSPALGTLFYMAPEQADLDALPDTRWDVYALGAILYRMLTGEPPYRSDAAVESFAQAGSLTDRLGSYREQIHKAPPPSDHRRVPGVDSSLAHIVDRCLAVKPAERYPNVQAVLDALRERKLRHARQPLLVLGIVGPALVMVIMALGAAIVLGNVLATSKQELTKLALESNRFSARSVANRFALEVDKRWRILQQEAADPMLRRYLEEGEGAQEQIQQWLEERHEHYNRQFTEDTAPQSWFINRGEHGIQIARSPYVADTVGKPWWFRDYFHGLGQELDRTQPRPYDLPIIRKPYRSLVFKSHATKTYMVAFSVPIWNEAGTEPLGVMAMTSELGQLVEFEGTRSQFVSVIDIRPTDDGKKGLVVVHPNLGDKQKRKLEWYVSEEVIWEAEKLQEIRVTDWQKKLTANVNVVSENHLGTFAGDFYDPVADDPHEGWLATMEPVVIPRVAADVVPSGWVVVVQEHMEHVTGPLAALRGYLLMGIIVSLAIVIAVVGALWGFVIAVLSSRTRFIAQVRHRLGLATTTPSTGGTPESGSVNASPKRR